jgi:putative endonuclease
MPENSTRSLGNFAEDYAVSLLESKDYKIIGRNFRCKLGEVDIIAENDGILVFVEVKARWSQKYGKPEEAVTPAKVRTIRRVADYYNFIHPGLTKKQRIDVVALEIKGKTVVSAKIIASV